MRNILIFIKNTEYFIDNKQINEIIPHVAQFAFIEMPQDKEKGAFGPEPRAATGRAGEKWSKPPEYAVFGPFRAPKSLFLA